MIKIEKVLLDDNLALCSPLARLLFIGILHHCDCSTLITASHRKLKAIILPYDDCNIDSLFNELTENQMINYPEISDEDLDNGSELGFYIVESFYNA